MHSRIYQVSSKRLTKDEWEYPEDFYENSGDFADYIGDRVEDSDLRKEQIGYLAKSLADLFDLDKSGRALVFKGGLDKFKKAWADAIREAAMKVTEDNVLDWRFRYDVRAICRETHLQSSYRLHIMEWNGHAGPMSDLIEWISCEKFKPGKKIYIGAIIDYHY